jgi:copper(I)-binding protein
MKRIIYAIPLIGLLAGPALAGDAADLAVSDAWSRATPPGAKTGVIYLTVTDKGVPDSLTGVGTPVAETAQLHESKTMNGVSQMRPVEAAPVSAEAPLKLSPGGYHIMLEGLKQPLKAGDTFPVTLTFAQAGTVTATVEIRALGAGAPAMSDHDMGNMDMAHPATTTTATGH